MKYGPIICDPTSEEAKALIGKKVIGNDVYTFIANPDDGCAAGVFERINPSFCAPFIVKCKVTNWGYTFIREVIEEKPKYRPYKDTEEMIDDYCERFGFVKDNWFLPSIWVTFPDGPKEIVSAFGKNTVWLNGDCFMLDYIFETGHTYLDGSPVGKEVKDD